MKKKILSFLTILIALLPLVVMAGGNSDDIVYNTNYESGYEYGNVTKCVKGGSGGIAYFVGIKKVSGYDVCLWTQSGNPMTAEFACDDPEMEMFGLGTVADTEGNAYKGLGCRKPKVNGNETVSDIMVAYTNKVVKPSMANSGSKCSIVSGDAVKLNGCDIQGLKNGTAIVKVTQAGKSYNYQVYVVLSSKKVYVGETVTVGSIINTTILGESRISINSDNKSFTAKVAGNVLIKANPDIYYEYILENRPTGTSSLDNNYNYGDVNECNLDFYGLGDTSGKVNFDGHTFCGVSENSLYYDKYDYTYVKITCTNSDYDFFPLEFTANGLKYKGFGCRQSKDGSNQYQIENVFIGQEKEYTGNLTSDYYECSITEGSDKAYFLSSNKCRIRFNSAGIVKVKVKHLSTGETKYYEYHVTEYVSENSTLDGSYEYANVSSCSIGSGTNNIVNFSGYNFCATSNSVYNLNDINASCPDSFVLFPIEFNSNGTLYNGYGCRKSLTSIGGAIPDIEKADCDSMLGDPDTQGTPAFYLDKAFRIIRYVAIILLVVLTMMDFIGATASNDQDAIKKSAQKAIIRAILCVAIFFLPTLIKIFLKYLNKRAIDLCGIGG